ncbi:O-fucosyltransferase 6 [Ranunculus cassubicifolius]
MAYQRRRNHYHQNNNKLRLLVPIISAISAVLLLLFALLSFLAPSPPENDQFRHHIYDFKLNNGGMNQTKEIEKQVFRVPIHGGSLSGHDLWISRLSKLFHGCSNATHKFTKAEFNTHPNRYLMIATSGGLNQQRTGITDAVVAARILNATLIVPKLDQKSFWKDSSNFTEIFDVDWFISSLSKDVKILKELPLRKGKVVSPYRTRVPRKCTPACYQKRVLPLLLKKQVVQLSKFDYRLANKLDNDLQKLRCRVNYHALRFTEPILNMGRQLVRRMRTRSAHFIALHLRFEPDMLAFSGCYYGGGEKEKRELGAIRKRWKTLHTGNPDKARRQGRCPLTPEEVGLMLRALGFGRDTHIYVASGEVYGGEETLGPLKALFPHFYSKETITRKDELSPFSSFSSRMAALDFIVCDESDVFVTNNNGNMAKILAGRRRYFGHKRTIRPNAKKLSSLFMNRHNMTWEAFASKVRTHQRGFMGEPNEVRPGRGEFHENPATCICEAKDNTARTEKPEPVVDDQLVDDEPEWTEMDYDGPQDKELSNTTDYNLFLKTEEQPELEDMLSD